MRALGKRPHRLGNMHHPERRTCRQTLFHTLFMLSPYADRQLCRGCHVAAWERPPPRLCSWSWHLFPFLARLVRRDVPAVTSTIGEAVAWNRIAPVQSLGGCTRAWTPPPPPPPPNTPRGGGGGGGGGGTTPRWGGARQIHRAPRALHADDQCRFRHPNHLFSLLDPDHSAVAGTSIAVRGFNGLASFSDLAFGSGPLPKRR